jgi:hypothetical protein
MGQKQRSSRFLACGTGVAQGSAMAQPQVTRLALTVISSLLFSAAAFGCAAQVVAGGSGGQGGDDGQGGAAACTAYVGVGCTPGETQPCTLGDGGSSPGTATCELVPGEGCATQWSCGVEVTSSTSTGTPLVLSFDGAPVEYLADRERSFDIDGTRSTMTDWPTARTPWLALDRDGDGRIGDGSELFGSMTVLTGGRRAPNGFVALRELDADGDGRITPNDPGFARLLVWSDGDGDRRSASGELASASTWELLSIDLDYTVDPRCDARGNCEVERASFRYRDRAGVERTGAIVDIHLPSQR